MIYFKKDPNFYPLSAFCSALLLFDTFWFGEYDVK